MSDETVTETVTLAEAAKMLETNLPRLSRLIDRPQYADAVRREQRPTKTGMRTVTLISVSVLPNLKAELQGKTETGREQKQKQSQDELLASVQSEVTFLRSELVAQREGRDKADSEFRRLLLSRDLEIARLQERVQLLRAAPPIEEPEPAVQETPVDSPEALRTTEASETVNYRQDGETGVQTNLERTQEFPAQRPRRWWEVWRR